MGVQYNIISNSNVGLNCRACVLFFNKKRPTKQKITRRETSSLGENYLKTVDINSKTCKQNKHKTTHTLAKKSLQPDVGKRPLERKRAPLLRSLALPNLHRRRPARVLEDGALVAASRSTSLSSPSIGQGDGRTAAENKHCVMNHSYNINIIITVIPV